MNGSNIYTENCQLSDQELFVKIRDSIVIGSKEDLSCLISANRDRIPSLCDGHGIRPIHLAVLYKKLDLVEILLSVSPSNVNSKSDVGLTPLHLAIAEKPKRVNVLISYYQNINRHPQLKTNYIAISIINKLASSGANILRSDLNYSILSLAALLEMFWLIPKLTQNMNVNVSDLFDLFSITAYTTERRTKSYPTGDKIRMRLLFLIKHGLPVGYSQVQVDPSLSPLFDEIQTCFAVNSSINILNGAGLRLLCLHKCIDLKNENIFGEVAQHFIYSGAILAILSKKSSLVKYFDLSRALYLYIILTLESCLLPSDEAATWKYEDAWIFYSKLWNSAIDHLSRLWSCDPEKFEITMIVPYMFQFFDLRLAGIFTPNYIFASDMEVHARITFNFLCVYTVLFLYLAKNYSTYLSGNHDAKFFSYLRLLLNSPRSRAHLFNLLIRPVNYEHTFKKYNISMESSISFLLHFKLGLNNRSCSTGSTVLHEVVNCLSSPIPVISFLLNVGAYPFSLDSNGKTFYDYLDKDLRIEVFKHPSLKRPYTLQTLCCLFLTTYGGQMDFYRTSLPPNLFTFLKLHAKYVQLSL